MAACFIATMPNDVAVPRLTLVTTHYLGACRLSPRRGPVRGRVPHGVPVHR
ncbi:MAG: hypothetical protein ACLSVD_02090 [Eggerthellaceae bacterium]